MLILQVTEVQPTKTPKQLYSFKWAWADIISSREWVQNSTFHLKTFVEGVFVLVPVFLLTNRRGLHVKKVVSLAERMVRSVKSSQYLKLTQKTSPSLTCFFSLSLLHRSDSTLNSTHSALPSHFFIVGHSLQVSFYLISNISSQICLQWQRGGCWLPQPLSHSP